jgi:hypothetical protein
LERGSLYSSLGIAGRFDEDNTIHGRNGGNGDNESKGEANDYLDNVRRQVMTR